MARGLEPGGTFTFSVVNGAPDRVVHLRSNVSGRSQYGGISIQVIRVGDWEWAADTLDGFRHHRPIQHVFLAEMSQLLCIDTRSCANNVNPIMEPAPRFRGGIFAMESETGVAMVSCPYRWFSSFPFMRLEPRKMEWTVVDCTEMENASWLLAGRGSFYRRGVEGKKIYTLFDNYNGPRPAVPLAEGFSMKGIRGIRLGSDAEHNICVHDLATGVSETLLPAPFVTKSVHWVDIGSLG